MTLKPSPLPWHVQFHPSDMTCWGVIVAADAPDDSNAIGIATVYNADPGTQAEADMEHILRAVNAHEQLVTALRDLELAANTARTCYYKRPGEFAAALGALETEAARARAVLATLRPGGVQ